MYSLMCLKFFFFFCKINKTDIKIGMNKGVFKHRKKSTYSVISTNAHKASKTTYKEKHWLAKKLITANKTSF